MTSTETSETSCSNSPPPSRGGRRLKIAVYGISKNEERHVARFMESVRDADQVLIADTGSTDETVAALRSAGAVVQEVLVSPWRFDDARNAALWLLGSAGWHCQRGSIRQMRADFGWHWRSLWAASDSARSCPVLELLRLPHTQRGGPGCSVASLALVPKLRLGNAYPRSSASPRANRLSFASKALAISHHLNQAPLPRVVPMSSLYISDA